MPTTERIAFARSRAVYVAWPDESWVAHFILYSRFVQAIDKGLIAPEHLGAQTSAEVAEALSEAGLIRVGRAR